MLLRNAKTEKILKLDAAMYYANHDNVCPKLWLGTFYYKLWTICFV